jgi:hypothetical protein
MPTTPTLQEMQELIDLLKQVDGLNDQNARSFAEVSKNAGNVTKETKRLKDELNSINNTFGSIAQSLKDSIQEFSKYNTTASNTKKTFSSLQSIAAKLLSDQSGYSRLTEKELKKLKEKITLDARNLAQNLASGQLTAEQAAETSDVLNKTAELVALTEKRLEREKEIQKAIGLTGNVLKGLSKIPGIGSALDTEQALEDMRDFADELKDKGENVNSFSNRLKIAGKGFSTAFGGLRKTLTDPVAILTFIVEKALAFNKTSVDIGKNLGTGAGESNKIAKNLANIANSSGNLNVTFKNAAEAMNQLNESTGLVANYSADALETQIMLTKQFGLTGEEAAGIYQYSVLTGESSSKVNDEMVGAFVATRNSVKVGANFKQVMAEAAKVSGQLAANFRNNPSAITAAVVQMKALGTTLEQTKSQGSALLDFESSLENELKAELLTGQQLNLERARAAALAGDQVELAKELSNQGMTLEKFSSMNVLAQNAYAQALGLNSDQLADQLKKQKLAEESGKSLADLTKEQALEAEKRQSIQDKFNAAIEKLQDFFGNLVGGPVGQLLEVLMKITDIVSSVLSPIFTVLGGTIDYILSGIKYMLPVIEGIGVGMGVWWVASKGIALANTISSGAMLKQLTTLGPLLVAAWDYAAAATEVAIAEIAGASALTLGIGIIAVIAGIAAAVAAFKSQKVGDMISPANGKTQVSTREGGLFELSPNDDLLAGPGLAKGDGGISGGSMSIDLTPMINAISEVRDAVNKLYSKEGIVSIDGKKIGTLLTQGSYKSA